MFYTTACILETGCVNIRVITKYRNVRDTLGQISSIPVSHCLEKAHVQKIMPDRASI